MIKSIPVTPVMTEAKINGNSGIFVACSAEKASFFENITPEHILVYIYHGAMQISIWEGSFELTAGQAILLGRNQLGKFLKEPGADQPYKAATVFFNKSFLIDFYSDHPANSIETTRRGLILYKSNPFLADLFRSVSVFSDLAEGAIPEDLAQLKMREAVTLLRMLDPATDALLSDFSEPHKIDLTDFMENNFMFNTSISRFAYLSGRSLATFKRDFTKTFGMAPGKWLTWRRLELAHVLIAEQHVKPSKAFVEVGFENFSHFTFAFKKFFGYTASSVMSR